MNCLWKWIRSIMAVVGGVLVFGGVGTSDFYALELGQKEPASVWWTIGIGFLMLIPLIVHSIIKEIRENTEDGIQN